MYIPSLKSEELQATVTAKTPNRGHSQQITVCIFPASGASICLAGLQLLTPMGVTKPFLTPCNKSISAVRDVMKCIGWLPVEFTLGDYFTTQPLYICHKIDRVYFSKTARIDVHIPHKLYPQPVNHQVAAAQSDEPTSKTTNPVKRTPPPTKLFKIPFGSKNENIPKLK